MTSYINSTFEYTSKLIQNDLKLLGINIRNLKHTDIISILPNLCILFIGLVCTSVTVVNGIIEGWRKFDEIFIALITSWVTVYCTLKYLSYIYVRNDLKKSCKWLFMINEEKYDDIVDEVALEVMKDFNRKCVKRVKYIILNIYG